MDVQYDYEKSLKDTHYIPVTIFTSMKEHFPIMMWAELFRTSPKFTEYYAPRDIMVAIEKCSRGDQDPWGRSQAAIGDCPHMMSITNQPDGMTKPSKMSRTGQGQEATRWSKRPSWQEWAVSEDQWSGWVDYSTSSAAASLGWQGGAMQDDASVDETPTRYQREQSEQEPSDTWTEQARRPGGHRAASSDFDRGACPWHNRP